MIMLTDNENPEFQCLIQFEYYIRSIKKDILNRNVRLLKVCSFLCTQYLVGPPLHELLHQCGMAWRQSARGTAQV